MVTETTNTLITQQSSDDFSMRVWLNTIIYAHTICLIFVQQVLMI